VAIAEELLSVLKHDKDSNIGSAANRLAIDEQEARRLAQELVNAGLAAWSGASHKRLRRVILEEPQATGTQEVDEAQAGDTGAIEPPELKQVGPLARNLWRALPSDGSQVTNVEIRSRDEFAEVDGQELQNARRELKRVGLVQLRPGRDGGGLRRLVSLPAETQGQDAVAQDSVAADEQAGQRLEHELYEPFRQWLVQELDEDSFNFAEVVITARARRQGKWTQPDLAQLTVTNFENLPTSTVELSTYELKRMSDAGKLEAVYEAAAHGRWAHRTHLVLEVADRDGKIAPEILKDAERFGLGVFKLWIGDDGKAFVQQLLASGIQTPDDADLDDMIGVVLDQLSNKLQTRYRQDLK
jgi:hypothetical protein